MFSQPEKNIEQFHVDPGMSVADLGSGAGFYSLAVSDVVGDTGTVYAIDVQKDLIQKLKNEADKRQKKNIKTIWSDIEEVHGSTLNDAVVDRVLIANTLFQVEHKEGLIKEAHRILRKNGKMLLVDWSDSFGGLGPHKEDVIIEERAKKICEENGFVFEKKISAGDHHYGMIFKLAN